MPNTLEGVKVEINELLETLEVNSNKLVLHNDDYNTFDWVIKSLVDVCEHSVVQAEQCSLIVHFKGKCSVKEGSKKQLSPLKEALLDRGLNATID